MLNKLYIASSAFRIWFLLSTTPKSAQPKKNIEISGCRGDNNTARLWFHRSIYGRTAERLQKECHMFRKSNVFFLGYCLSRGIWTMSWRKIAECEQKGSSSKESWFLAMNAAFVHWIDYIIEHCNVLLYPALLEHVRHIRHIPQEIVFSKGYCYLRKTGYLTAGLHFFKELHPSEAHILWHNIGSWMKECIFARVATFFYRQARWISRKNIGIQRAYTTAQGRLSILKGRLHIRTGAS